MDLDVLLNLACAYGTDVLFKYALSVLVLPFSVVVFIMLGLGSRVLLLSPFGKYVWTWPKTVNAVGGLLMLFFNAAGLIALRPMSCYIHPTGDHSVMRLPTVICGRFEHMRLVALGVTLLCCMSVFYAAIVYTSVALPRLGKSYQAKVIVASNFLIRPFDKTSWYWACILIPRGLLLCTVGPISISLPHAQLMMTLFVCAGYACLLSLKIPWGVGILNLMDAMTSLLMSLFVVASFAQLPLVQGRKRDWLVLLMSGAMSLEGVLVVLTLLATIALAVCKGIKTEVLSGQYHRMFTMSKLPNLGCVSALLFALSKAWERDCGKRGVEDIIGNMTVRGQQKISNAVSILCLHLLRNCNLSEKTRLDEGLPWRICSVE